MLSYAFWNRMSEQGDHEGTVHEAHWRSKVQDVRDTHRALPLTEAGAPSPSRSKRPYNIDGKWLFQRATFSPTIWHSILKEVLLQITC